MKIRNAEGVSLIRLGGILIETRLSNPNYSGPWTLLLHCCDGQFEVVTNQRWHFSAPTPERMRKVRVSLRVEDNDVDEIPFYVIDRVDEDPNADIFSCMPPDLGPVPGAVARIQALVDDLHCSPLRRFLSNVFTIPEVYQYYWSCPASQGDHHRRAGGLAGHSLEMAEQAWSIDFGCPEDRDFAVVGAIIHDIGKVWTHDAPQDASLHRLGHQIVGMHMMAPAITRLRKEWEDGATAVLDLLQQGVPYRPRPLMPIGRVVAGLDACSAVRDLAAHPEQVRRRVWVPRWGEKAMT